MGCPVSVLVQILACFPLCSKSLFKQWDIRTSKAQWWDHVWLPWNGLILEQLLRWKWSWGDLNIMMPSYQYWNSHYKDKTVSWPAIFIMEILITGMMISITKWGLDNMKCFMLSGWCDILVIYRDFITFPTAEILIQLTLFPTIKSHISPMVPTHTTKKSPTIVSIIM